MDRMHQQENHRSRKGKSPATPASTPSSEPPRTCPRCDSANTKFCYYNNYSSSQPRYFCRACRRYWTQGGTIRNLPHASAVRRGVKLAKRPAPSSHPAATAGSTSLPPLHLQVSAPAATEMAAPWNFSGTVFFRRPMGYNNPPIPRLSPVLPEMERVLNPGLVLRPPAPPAAAEAGEDSERFFSGLFPGFQDVSGGEAAARQTPATSSGPFI